MNKPAHTVHRLEVIFPGARVGLQSRVGLDLVLGGAAAPAGVLGVDAVLGPGRPEYVRRFDGRLLD